MKLILSIITISLLISGCAGPPIVPYPDFENSVKLLVSKDIISTWTETAASDQHIQESQVFIAHPESGLGLLGGIVGALIEEANKSKSDIGDLDSDFSLSNLQLYFDTDVMNIISDISDNQQDNNYPEIILVDDVEDSNFKLLPSIKLIPSKKNTVSIEFRLTTRYYGSAKKPLSKHYSFLPLEAYSLDGDDGWFGSKKIFDELSEQAFKRLTVLFLDDVIGDLSPKDNLNLKLAKFPTTGLYKTEQSVAVLKSDEPYSTIVSLDREGRPFLGSYAIVSNSILIWE